MSWSMGSGMAVSCSFLHKLYSMILLVSILGSLKSNMKLDMCETIFKTFYFERLIDTQEVANEVEGRYTVIPDPLSVTVLGNFSTVLKLGN